MACVCAAWLHTANSIAQPQNTRVYAQTVWWTLACFGLSLMALSLLCVTVILLSTETLLEITLKCIL